MRMIVLLLILFFQRAKANTSVNNTRVSSHIKANLMILSLIKLSNNISNTKSNSTPTAACPGRCESGWTYFDRTDACYKIFLWGTFDDAENICKSNGGHLTSIHSFDENAFVAALAKTGLRWTEWTQLTWIGLKQASYPSSEQWTWTDGTQVDFSAWAPNEPNNDGGEEHCAQLYSDHHTHDEDSLPYRKWNDENCAERMRSFVCKKMAM